MCQINTIKIICQIPFHWNLLFVSTSVLGIYISLVLAMAKRTRLQHKLLLPLYTTLLSILLLSITCSPSDNQQLNALLTYCEMAALYLIGPVSYRIFTENRKAWSKRITLFWFLPTPVSVVLFGVLGSPGTWLHTGGVLYTGIWLILQSTIVYRESRTDEQLLNLPHSNMSNWNQRYTIIQLLLFAAICICLATDTAGILIAGILSILILVIWFRILFTAYTTYSTNNP